MSMLNSVKDAVLGQAMKLAGSPQVTRLMTDPRLMNAAMKAMSVGGTVKAKLDQCGKLAGGVFGLATQDEVSNMRSTIQNLEDQVAVLESRAAASEAESDFEADAPSSEGQHSASGKKSGRGKKHS